MKFIIEGPDRAGKTTYATKLAKKYQLSYKHLSYKDDRRASFYEGLLFTDNTIYDRFFISEYVYSKILKRPTDVTKEVLKKLIEEAREQDWEIIICLATDYDLTGEPDFVTNNHSDICEEFFKVAKEFNITIKERGN